jgi:S1-C subfamily serine protease
MLGENCMRRVCRASIWLGLGLALVAAGGAASAETASDLPQAGKPGSVDAAALPTGDRQVNGVSLARIEAALDNIVAPPPDLSASIGGSHSAQLYRRLSPLVVLVVTDDGLGSGSLITSDGYVLTNNHVIIGFDTVGVILKPQGEGDAPSDADAYAADVVKLDEVADLALLKIRNWPDSGYIELGDADAISVGDDVHAIGHPKGETWTYTKGVISAMRRGYNWAYDNEFKHQADVIQTQTPINPGNSGGPLISDGGRLIGVNSFKQEGEGLNFAVSVGEVEKFLKAAEGGAFDPKLASAAPEKTCKVKVMYEGRASSDDAFIRNMDMYCTGKVNATLYVPDDKSKPIVFRADTNKDGKVDAWVFDEDRDGKWDYSLWDTDFDGKPDLKGFHPDGKLEPSRYEKYQPKS